MNIEIRQAVVDETAAVSEVLCEAAAWLESRGIPLWTRAELQPLNIHPDVAAGFYFIALDGFRLAGAFKCQPEDTDIWAGTKHGEAYYLHRLVVRREYAGGKLAPLMLQWAAHRASLEGRRYLRLDCDSSRAALRAIYERFGFVHHSDYQYGPYHVARYQLPLTAAA